MKRKMHLNSYLGHLLDLIKSRIAFHFVHLAFKIVVKNIFFSV